jgi:hypothetical protein
VSLGINAIYRKRQKKYKKSYAQIGIYISTRSKGCPLRRDEVLLMKKLGYDGWKRLTDTGRRRISEIFFLSLKSIRRRSPLKKFKAQKVEGVVKVILYNNFIGL